MEAAVPTIRLLAPVDLDAAFRLSAGAGWNQRLDDWRMLLQLAPAGGFAATMDDGTIVGTAIGIDYGTFGWIAMMLVDPAWRGRGLGARLLEAAIGAVRPGIPIRLDATPLGRPLYRRYGFVDEDALTRHVAEPLDVARGGPARAVVDRTVEPLSKRVRRLTADRLPAVIETDDQIFGAHRRILLEWALDNAAQYAHTIDSDAGVQYLFRAARAPLRSDRSGSRVRRGGGASARARVASRGRGQGGCRGRVRPAR